ncbi:HNH endonuclease [Escherichia coli]|nr:HNH endonuclease [Escherichia coli]
MTKNTKRNEQPDESIKDLFYIGDDGYLYFYDVPENSKRIKKGETRVGANFNGNNKSAAYPQISFEGKHYKVHRIMWWLKTGEWFTDHRYELDHINQNKADYRFENLRKVTSSQNAMNKNNNHDLFKVRKLKDGTVSYYCYVTVDRVSKYIGTFYNEIEATYAAWKTRDLMFPGYFPVPENIKHLVEVKS